MLTKLFYLMLLSSYTTYLTILNKKTIILENRQNFIYVMVLLSLPQFLLFYTKNLTDLINSSQLEKTRS